MFNFRLELTGFIKEVRHNKHGSLTGLSLEDIVASVSELVEQKTKVRTATVFIFLSFLLLRRLSC